MKTTFLKAFAALAVAALTTLAAQAAEGWSDNFQDSLTKAKTEKKLLLAEFTGSDWCPPCKKQAAEVFSQQEFKAYAAKKLVLVELDYPRSKPLSDTVKAQNQELKTKYAIRGYPTVVVFDGEGQELARWVGYGGGGPAALIAKIEALKK
jgi:protein disulfide-isomerase